jgi:hypothetical protein
MSKNKDISSNFQKGDLFGSSPGSSDSKLPNSFDEIFGRLKLVFGVETDTDFARCMGFKQGSVSGAKQKKAIPPAWITEVALSKGVSADWLLTGEGEMRRDGGAKFANLAQTRELMQGRVPGARVDDAAAEPATLQASIFNDSPRKDVSIADLLSKTARVLESNTVYREALYSNIEAFHHGVTMDERVNKMELQFSQAMASFQSQLDQLRDENKQLRHELEESRSQSAVRDTG